MNYIYINILFLFALFVGLLCAFHLVFIYWLKLSKVAWKKLDYIWLGLAAAGIIMLSADVRQWVSSFEYAWAKERTDASYALLKSRYGGEHPPSYICREFVRTEFSPKNLDAIQEEYDSICEWSKSFVTKLPQTAGPQYPELKFEEFKPKRWPRNGLLQQYLSDIQQHFDWYNQNRTEMEKRRNAIHKNEVEAILFFLSPIMLCISLAIRITKVTAEIKFET